MREVVLPYREEENGLDMVKGENGNNGRAFTIHILHM
jgi:hypothetical protein